MIPRFPKILLLLIIGAALIGCNSALPTVLPGTASPAVDTIPKRPPLLAGKAGIAGRVVSMEGDKPFSSTVVRLAQVHRGTGEEGAFVLDGANSPGAITTVAGYFVLDNVEAAEYVLVVGDVMGAYAIVTGQDGRARVWGLTPDNYLDTDTIRVTLGN